MLLLALRHQNHLIPMLAHLLVLEHFLPQEHCYHLLEH
jgi:hypothetical protein